MEDIEFEILKKTMLILYGVCVIETDKDTGEKRIIDPKMVTIIHHTKNPEVYGTSLNDMLLGMKSMGLK